MKKNIGQGYARKGLAFVLAISMVLPTGFVSIGVAFADEAADISSAVTESVSVDSVVDSVKEEVDRDEIVSTTNDVVDVVTKDETTPVRKGGSSSNNKDKVESTEVVLETLTTPTSYDTCPVPAAPGRTIVNFADDAYLCSYDLSDDCTETETAPVSLSAGTYKVTLVSQDGYENRTDPQYAGQLWEKFSVSLSNGSGFETPHTEATADLADGVVYATNYISLGDGVVENTFVVAEDVTTVTATHDHWMVSPGWQEANSVQPVCAVFDEVVVAPACFAPSTLGDTDNDFVHEYPEEPSLQSILDGNGYSLDVQNDQTNIQNWNGNSQTVTIEAEYIAKHASRHQVFGYYLNGDESTFVPVFKVGDHTDYPAVPSFAPGQDVSVVIPSSSSIGFAIDTQDISSGEDYILATEISENEDGSDHAVVFDLDSDDYVIAFEDLLNGVADYDYNDLVVRVSLTSCGPSNPQNTPPTITLVGSNPLTVTVGQVFVDPGATATDAEDGDLTKEIVVTGTVDANTVGSYVLTYTVTDSGGLTAQTSRKVDVVPDSNPTTGSITICKMIVNQNGVVATGNAGLPAGSFGITLNSVVNGAPTPIQTAQFDTTTFVPNTSILSNNYDADINNDGAVNVTDLLAVIGAWGPCAGDCPADINGDGQVNSIDLQLVKAFWTDSYNPGTSIGDVNGDGIVNVSDLLAVIGAWGQTSGPADINEDGIVDNTDLQIVIATWGMTTHGYDAECITYNNLPFGEYSYNEETITGGDWGRARYNDQYDVNVNSLNDFFPFDPNNINSNGGITLSAASGMSHRTLVVLNTYSGGPTGQEEICGNGIDDDGDGQIDEDCNPPSQNEICDNDIDDDGDGQVDENCGGGGGGGGGRRNVRDNDSEVLGVQSCDYLRDYLKMGWNNDVFEVVKLQVFLKQLEGFSTLPVTGIYDQATFDALSQFQNRYFDDILKPWGHTAPTGFTYILTKKKVNEIVCQRMFPLNAMQEQEIREFNAFLASLGGDFRGGMGGDMSGGDATLRDIVVGEISSTSTENTELANAFRNQNGKTKSMMGTVLGDMSFSNLASAVFTLPADRAALLQCVYYLLMILIAIYILGTILANAQNSNTHTKEQIAARRLGFFSIGIIIAILAALWFKIFCLIVPLVIILIILGISLLINRNNSPKTISTTKNVTTIVTTEKKEEDKH